MFGKFWRPMKNQKGNYVYIFYSKTMKFNKLHQIAFGPFPMTHISCMPGTDDPVGVTVNIGT